VIAPNLSSVEFFKKIAVINWKTPPTATLFVLQSAGRTIIMKWQSAQMDEGEGRKVF